jgi:DNA polymerase I-like protein with 3'-5' exonuclease and polymerase domains
MTPISPAEFERLNSWRFEIAAALFPAGTRTRDEGDERKFSGQGFSINRKTGAWFSFTAGKGGQSAIRMIAFLGNYSQDDALRWGAAFLAAHPGTGAFKAAEDEHGDGAEAWSADEAREILANAVDVIATPAEIYLRSRSLDAPFPGVQYLPDARVGEGAVVAVLRAHDREVGIQLTYIDSQGRKSVVAPLRRRLMFEKCPEAAFFMPFAGQNSSFTVCEGLEDTLSAFRFGRRHEQVIGLPGIGGLRHQRFPKGTRVAVLAAPKNLQGSDWSAPRLSQGQVAYAASDAVLAYRLWPKLRTEIVTKKRTEAYLLQRRAIPAVAAMESYGLRLDQEEHAKQVADWSEKLTEARRAFNDIAGDPPPTNDNQVRDWLLRTVPQDDLMRWPRTDRGNQMSVEGKHLKRLLHLPGIQEVITMRAMQQRISNFGQKLVGFISPATGRIHASYHLAATKAGRFSCSKPNLQQLPGDKSDPQFRRCIAATPGNVLVGCDWSQVEMRAAAWISGCRTMSAIYTADPVRDLHRETAAAISRVPYDLVTQEQRQSAKPVNFGSIYGIGAVSLAEDAFDGYGVLMTDAEAQLALDRFFETYAGFNTWRWDHWQVCKATQRVVVPGSGRTVEAQWEHNGVLRFTQCCNLPISGRAADAMLLALQLLHDRLQGLDAHLIASVHDELLVEANERDAERVRAILEETMIEAFVLTFPGAPSHSVAEAAIGANWFDVKHPKKEGEPENQAGK